MKIGITQRVDIDPNTQEIRDCLDQKWQNFSIGFNLDLVQIPNKNRNISNWLENMDIDGFILSGGNDIGFLENASNTNQDRDLTEKIILDFAEKENLPVLGVCRGAQMINYYFQGNLIPLKNHVGTIHPLVINLNNNEIEKKIKVNSFHKWGINHKALGKDLFPFAWDSDGNIEGIKHKELNWTGIMWHPERNNQLEDIDKVIFFDLFYK